MKNGYRPIIIKKQERASSDEVLDRPHTTMNDQPFIALVSEDVIESEKLWASILD